MTSMLRLGPRRVVLCLTVATLCPTFSAAQVERFHENITVVEVEIPVRVLRGSEPVRGLTADDFEVLERGEPREIVSFRVIDILEERTSSRVGPGAVRPNVGDSRSFLILFDFMFSGFREQARAVVGAREMVADQLDATDRVAVGYLSGSAGFRLLVGFTDDRARIAKAIDVVAAMAAHQTRRFGRAWVDLQQMRVDPAVASEEREGQRVQALIREIGVGAALSQGPMGSVDGPWVAGPGSPVVGVSRDETITDPVLRSLVPSSPEALGNTFAAGSSISAIRFLTLEMERMATWLRDVSGQKHIVYLSQGFGEGLLADHKVSNYLQRMFEGLRRNGWTLHAVDLDGIPGPFDGPAFAAGDLFFMANETGGDLLENYNHIGDATRRIMSRTSVIYVLTIRPELVSDGRLRPLKVRLRGHHWGLRVSYRPAYYAPKEVTDRNPLERRLDAVDLLLGDAQISDLPARILPIAFPSAAGAGVSTVPVVIEVEGASLMSDDDPRVRFDLEIHLYALDEGGGVQDLLMQDLRIDKRKVGEVLERGGLRFLGSLELAPGSYRLRLLVRKADRMTIATEKLVVYGPPARALMPPLFLPTNVDDWLIIRAARGKGAAARRPEAAIFLNTGSHDVPTPEPTVVAGTRQPFLFVVPTSAGPVSVRIVDELDEAIEGGEVELLGRRTVTSGTVVEGELRSGTLAPGRYRLQLSVGPEGTTAAQSAPFRVAL